MAIFTDINKPTTPTMTDISKPHAATSARYSHGRFGQARYGQTEGHNPINKPAVQTFTDIQRPI